MGNQFYKGLVVSDFNTSNFVGYLSNDPGAPQVQAVANPFGQVVQTLTNRTSDYWRNPAPDFFVAWTQPQCVINSFNSIVNGQSASLEEVFADVDWYASLLASAASSVRFAFISTWVMPSYNRGLGMLDLKSQRGVTSALMRMNLRLMDNLEKTPNLYILGADRWFQLAGRDAFNPKFWYLGKIAYSNDVYKEAVIDVKAALQGITGQSRKLILLDLDDTLWGGVVGDLGWEKIRLGGHDAVGEAFVDFQRALKALKNRGILLGIVSKNEEDVALTAIDHHPEMVLRSDDFSGWRINWGDKAQNIAELVSELNLGLQSVVFIDDNPVERARVKEAFPEILVPDWPEDKMLYRKALLELTCFDVPVISQEDLERTDMYVAERKRTAVKKEVISLDKWLESLDMKVVVAELDNGNVSRATQLLNKTNQMNLTTRRLTETELTDWAKQTGNRFWVFSVTDRFGNYGLTGIGSIEMEGRKCRIVDFILSCRVMGRKVEETMLYHLIRAAKELKAEEVIAEYLLTPKNKPCLSFFETSGLAHLADSNIFSWKTSDDYSKPTQVEIVSGPVQNE
jgi:FkbH-like protein